MPGNPHMHCKSGTPSPQDLSQPSALRAICWSPHVQASPPIDASAPLLPSFFGMWVGLSPCLRPVLWHRSRNYGSQDLLVAAVHASCLTAGYLPYGPTERIFTYEHARPRFSLQPSTYLRPRLRNPGRQPTRLARVRTMTYVACHRKMISGASQ